MSEIQLNSLESLWRAYHLRLQDEPDLSIRDFASEHASFKEEILKLFPMLKDLSEFAKDPIGNPERIGRYDVVRQIGIGGMGVVYEATSETLHERVAIKVVEASFLVGKAVNRLEQEARLVATLHHSNIVPVYEFGKFESNHFYTMRFIDGPNLSEVLHHDVNESEDELSAKERRSLEIAETLAENWELQTELIRQAASAIAYAHAQGILHRDVKPANLLIDATFKLWVTDFGLAKLRANDPRDTVRSKMMGTPRYMAPEQIRGEADERSDIFGLGLTLYEMTLLRKAVQSGRQPIWKGGLRPPSEFNPNVPAGLERIIMKAVSLDPDHRHHSANELLQELDQFTAELARASVAKANSRDSDGERSRRHSLAEEPSRSVLSKIFVGAACVVVGLLLWASLPWFNGGKNDHLTPSSRLSVADSGTESAGSNDSALKADQRAAASIQADNQLATENPESAIERRDADTNEPPSFASHMFAGDGQTIVLDESSTAYPTALEISDDQDSVFDGLLLSITGGADKDWFGMTPVGVFAFVRPIDAANPIDANHDHIYEIEVSASDRSHAYCARLEEFTDGKFDLVRDTLARGAKLESHVLASDITMPEGLVDIATADGKTFFHIHRDADNSASLFRSRLSTDGKLETELLNRDCGIDQTVLGLATLDGQLFMHAIRSSGNPQDVSLFRSELKSDGTFVSSLSLERSHLPPQILGLSWLDGDRFQYVRTNAKGTSDFYFAFRGPQQFVNMPLDNEHSQFDKRVVGHAAWVERGAGSTTTIRPIRVQVAAAE